MALIDKTSIGTGNTIQAEHITRIIDALNESGSYEIIATGSFTGSFTGDGSGLTGVTVTSAPSATSASYAVTASHALYAVSASYEINYETSSSYADFAKTASYVKTAQTASYINVSNIAGEIIATSASYVNTAQTSSYIVGSNVDGTVALATTASYATTSRQLTNTTRTVYTFTTNDDTPYQVVGPFGTGTKYGKAIVLGLSTSDESVAGEFIGFWNYNSFVTTTLNNTGTLYQNLSGGNTASFTLNVDGFTATGDVGVTINWRVILETSTI